MKELIKYFFFLIALGGVIVSTTLYMSSRPDREEVRRTIMDKLEPIDFKLQNINSTLSDIKEDLKRIKK